MNEYKTKKVIIKIQQTDLDFSLESNFVVTKRLLVLVYSNEHAAFKRFKAKRYCLPEGLIDNYNVIINEKTFYDQGIDSDIKWYQETRKLTKREGEDYTTRCLLDYDSIKAIID